MGLLTTTLPYEDRLGNAIYWNFRNMLQLDSLMHGQDLKRMDFWLRALVLLYGDMHDVKGDAVQLVQELIWFYMGGETPQESQEKPVSKPLYDFELDAEYIYAAFLECYHIDLTSVDTQLHWWQFMALFKALPESTQMSSRICYRGTDTSKLKGEEKKRIERIQKAIAIKRGPGGSGKPLTAQQAHAATIERRNKRLAQAKAYKQQQIEQAEGRPEDGV